jgi:hypothetical protein
MELEAQHRWWKQTGARELRQLVHEVWDPIGVRDIPEAQSEYDDYVGGIISRLHKGADPATIADYLSWAQDRMGLAKPANELRDVAERITAWYSASMNQ